MLTTLATCPRRFRIEYEDNWRLKGRRHAPWPPRIKSVLADALHERDRAVVRGLGTIRTRAAADAVVMAYRHELLRMVGEMGRDEAQRWTSTIEDITDEATRILAHYGDTLGGISDPQFMVDKTGRPLVDRVVEFPLGLGDITYAARIDGVLDRGQLGPAVLVRKFTSTTDPQTVADDMGLDQWLAAAMWIASKAAETTITAATVEVVRTKAPAIPETVKCRNCKGKGTIPSRKDEDGEVVTKQCGECNVSGVGGMSRSACDTSLEQWNATVRANGLDPDVENERCASALERIIGRGETFAYRVGVESTVEAVKAWVADVHALIGVEEHHRSARIWPRNGAACRGHGSPCPYRKGCSHRGGTDEVAAFVRHEDPYPGLA